MDVKPGNVLSAHRPRGCVAGPVFKLADFGLACRADGSWPVEEGDRRYCAREVIAGARGHLPAGDVFSLGVMLWELAAAAAAPDDGVTHDALRDGTAAMPSGLSAAFRTQLQVRASG